MVTEDDVASIRKEIGDNIDEFLRAYVECAIWLSTVGEEAVPMDQAGYDKDDLVDEAIVSMKKDCDSFRQANAALLEEAYQFSGYTEAQAGHDFWLTRNGHGAGYWDRDLGEIGDKLTHAAHSFGESDLYVGDDGKVYVS